MALTTSVESLNNEDKIIVDIFGEEKFFAEKFLRSPSVYK